MRIVSAAGSAFVVAILLAGVRAAHAQSPAQAPAYLEALTVPPPAVGTCVSAPAVVGRETGAGELHGHRLAMTSREPGGRREMTVYTDAAGLVRRYEDMTHLQTGATAGVGQNLLAAVTPNGVVSGLLIRSTVAMKMPAVSRLDSASLRVMREGASGRREADSLSAREQEQVRAAAAWLLRRCPT